MRQPTRSQKSRTPASAPKPWLRNAEQARAAVAAAHPRHSMDRYSISIERHHTSTPRLTVWRWWLDALGNDRRAEKHGWIDSRGVIEYDLL